MKILQINRNHFIGGGADRVYLNTGNLLEEHGYQVKYFSTQNKENFKSNSEQYFVSSIDTRNTSLFSKIKSVKKYLYNNEAIDNLIRLVKEFKPDIAHIHLFYGVLSSSILKTLNDFKIPIVITIHDYRLLCPANAMLDKSGKICEKCVNNKFYNCILKRCSDGNVFQSSVIATEAYLRNYLFDPLVLVNHFIFVSQFSKNKHVIFDKRYDNKSTHLYNFGAVLNINLNLYRGDYLFYYGRLSKEKGILTLINAVKKSNTKLKIAGDGPLKTEVLNAIDGFPCIEYVGFKSGDQLNELIKNSAFVVVPSQWYENNPMTIVESFSFGKPVIGSKIGGIPELVNDETGFIFDFNSDISLINAIEKAEQITNEQYAQLSENCFNFSKNHFSKETHLNKLITIYNKVLDEYV
jgi:glycosyltransferase involved in cell wall biosynthesis